jgi:hypothetical protein
VGQEGKQPVRNMDRSGIAVAFGSTVFNCQLTQATAERQEILILQQQLLLNKPWTPSISAVCRLFIR